MRKVILTFLSFFIIFASEAAAQIKHKPFKDMTLKELEAYQKRIITHDRFTIQWWNAHKPWPAVRFLTVRGHKYEPYDLWWHKQQLKWTLRELAKTQRRLQAASVVAHHALWMCIHGDPAYGSHYGNEARSWQDHDSGGNSHYGGLQMHKDWYSLSGYADQYSQDQQEQAAELAYKQSNYSRVWLTGQWGQTIGPCWKYAHA